LTKVSDGCILNLDSLMGEEMSREVWIGIALIVIFATAFPGEFTLLSQNLLATFFGIVGPFFGPLLALLAVIYGYSRVLKGFKKSGGGGGGKKKGGGH